jgi:hypothetical protein
MSRATSGEFGAVHQHGGDGRATGFLVLHRSERMHGSGPVMADQCRGKAVQRHASGAVDHRCRKVVEAETGHPTREPSTQRRSRSWFGGHVSSVL